MTVEQLAALLLERFPSWYGGQALAAADPRALVIEMSRTDAEWLLPRLGGEEPSGPWQVEQLTNVDPPWFVRPYGRHSRVFEGHHFASEAEAVAVRDALNRVAAGARDAKP